MPIISRLKKFIFSYDWEIVEIQGAITKVLWAVWLLMPFPAFRTVSGYTAVASENVWGIGLLVLGSLHLFSVLSHYRGMRKLMTFVAFLFWLFTITLVWLQSHTSPLIVFFFVIAIFMFFNFLRLWVKPANLLLHERRVVDQGPPDGMPERREYVK